MAVAVGDIIRIIGIFEWITGDKFTNTSYFRVTRNDTANDDGLMDEVAIHMDSLYARINTDVSFQVAYDQIEGLNVTQDVLLPPKAWPVLTIGGNASDGLPTQTSACVYYRTLRPRTRASVFLPPYGEGTNQNGGVIDVSATANMQAFGDFQVPGILQVLLEADYGAYNIALDRFTQVVLALTAGRFRTQRRRRVGVGS